MDGVIGRPYCLGYNGGCGSLGELVNGRMAGLIASIAVGLLALAALSGSSVEARGVSEPVAPAALAPDDLCTTGDECGYPIYECFLLTPLGRGALNRAIVTLETDSFGFDPVEVRAPFMICESGLKFPLYEGAGVAPGAGNVFACYWTTNGNSIYQAETLATDNFGSLSVLVRRAEFMCESARKEHNGITTEAASAGLSSSVWQCFATYPVFTSRRFSVVTDNFGYHNISTFGAAIRCEDAVKYRDGHEPYGVASGRIQQCFAMVNTPLQPIWEHVTVTTNNFGRFDALGLQPFFMCESAKRLR